MQIKQTTNQPRFHLTAKSGNVKTGPIPVSTSANSTCPDACPLKSKGCYASAGGPLALHWRKVSEQGRGDDWATFVSRISALPSGQLWRHNQAGDLPTADGTVDAVKLGQLVAANAGKRGFTYSHHRDTQSIAWIRHANAWGFTVNLSANDLVDADALADHQAGPVVVVLPSTQTSNTTTPAGRPVVICPATQRDDVSCASCQLCQRQRAAIVGFPAHGSRHRVINLRLASA